MLEETRVLEVEAAMIEELFFVAGLTMWTCMVVKVVSMTFKI
jgi:hypothetical protein